MFAIRKRAQRKTDRQTDRQTDVYTRIHKHTPFITAILPGDPGLAGCPPQFSSTHPGSCIPLGQAKTFHITLNTTPPGHPRAPSPSQDKNKTLKSTKKTLKSNQINLCHYCTSALKHTRTKFYFWKALSLRFNGHFPGEPRLASFITAKDDGSGGDNWSCKTCKALVKSSPPTPNFLQAGCPSCHPTNTVRALKGKYRSLRTCSPQAHLVVFQLCL